MTRIRLAVVGDGKMGRAVRELADAAGFDVVAFIGEGDVLAAGPTPVQLAGAQVAIEFTVPGAAATNVIACAKAGVPVVCGTTGWEAARGDAEAAVRAAKSALLWSPNFAIGVHVFARLVELAAVEVAAQPGIFDVHMTETHHAAKRDAPSGTARMLADRMKKALHRDVPIDSIRTGDVPGTHELILDAAFDQIRLTHEARDRRVFAAGALTAARWIVGRTGVFTMDDLLEAR